MKARIYPVGLATMSECDYSHNVYDTDFGRKVEAAMLGFIVEDGEDLIVFDTGPNFESFMKANPNAPLGGNPQKAFTDKFKEINRGYEEVTRVVLSHLHSDHIGNYKLFENAKIYVQSKEADYAAAPIYGLYYEPDEVAELLALGERVVRVNGDAQLTRNVRLLLLAGHTVGSQVALVDTDKGRVALAGDFVCVYENMRTRSVTVTDVDAWVLSLRRLSSLADIVLPGHEPRVLEDYPSIP